jgi:hypothetical protein
MNRSATAFLIAGGVLMILLGLARSGGGIALLARGTSTLPDIQASPATVKLLGMILLLIGIAEAAAGAGVLARRRWFWTAGIVTTAIFVLDGAVNGALLFGRPGDRGTIMNLAAAAVILLCLFRGRSALRLPATSPDPPAPPRSNP